jgi:hypothetical protein
MAAARCGTLRSDLWSASNSPNTDERLWIVLKSTAERGFIVGSCHTFQGRFRVWFPTDGHARCVSKFEVGDSSSEAAYWMAGFLNGAVPGPPEDPEREAEWIERRSEFLATDEWPGLHEELLSDDPDGHRRHGLKYVRIFACEGRVRVRVADE